MQVAACLYAMGKADEAAACRAEIDTLLNTEKLLYLLPVFMVYKAKLKLLNGDKAAAKDWLANYFVTESDHMELRRIYMHFTSVRAYIVLGDYEKAKNLSKKLCDLCSGYHRLLDAAEASVLLTVVMWLMGQKQEALSLLQKTLLQMEPYGFIRVFADEGKTILPILKKLMKKENTENNQGMPSGNYLREVYQAVYEQSKRYTGIIAAPRRKHVKLSPQQKHIIELLAKGYKNAEIVELTGLSINTVRYHTKEAYRKLEVNNAADAVSLAKELNLI